MSDAAMANAQQEGMIFAIVALVVVIALIVLIVRGIGKAAKKSIAKGKEKKQGEKMQAFQAVDAEQKRLLEEVNQALAQNGFKVSKVIRCMDRMYEEPSDKDRSGFEKIMHQSRVFAIDAVHRRVMYAALGDSKNMSASSAQVYFWDYDQLRGVDVIYDGVKETTSTRLNTTTRLGSTNTYVSNSNEIGRSSQSFVSQLGIKLMLRDPVNPTFTINLLSNYFMLSGRLDANSPGVRACVQFAGEVRDTVNAIIQG